MQQIWNDCDGGVLSTELLLLTSVLVAGLSTGLTSVRDAVIGEFADVANSVQSLNQSFLYHGPQSPSAMSSGSEYVDEFDPISSSPCIVLDEVR